MEKGIVKAPTEASNQIGPLEKKARQEAASHQLKGLVIADVKTAVKLYEENPKLIPGR